MMRLTHATPADVLNALSGTAYIVDPDGVLLFAGGSEWDTLLTSSGAFLPPWAVFGRNLFDMIAGERVQAAYRAIHARVLEGQRHLGFDYRCDAPDLERLMRMAIGPITVGEGVAGVLYQSTLLRSTARIPLEYLTNDERLREQREASGAPIVTICAWCADVSDGAHEWFKPAEYYRRGGASGVRLSHGVCPACEHGVVAELLDG